MTRILVIINEKWLVRRSVKVVVTSKEVIKSQGKYENTLVIIICNKSHRWVGKDIADQLTDKKTYFNKLMVMKRFGPVLKCFNLRYQANIFLDILH